VRWKTKDTHSGAMRRFHIFWVFGGEECWQKCRVVTEINPYLKTFHKC